MVGPTLRRVRRSVVDDDEHLALLDDVAGGDLDLGHPPGALGEHGDLHLHRLEEDELVTHGDDLVGRHLHGDDVGDQLRLDPVTHGTQASGPASSSGQRSSVPAMKASSLARPSVSSRCSGGDFMR